MRNTGSTALLPGWYVEFQAALLRQAPRPGEIDQVTAEGWTNNQKSLKNKLAGCLVHPLDKVVIQEFAPSLILRCLSGLVIPSCDGDRRHTLANAKEIFKSFINPAFKKWGLDKQDVPTKETVVAVYEIRMYEEISSGTFAQIFGSFGVNLDKLCLTQHQIKVFYEKHDWYGSWRDSCRVFFLIKKDWDMPATPNNLFVVCAFVNCVGGGLCISVNRFDVVCTFNTDSRHYVVIPQL